jgi:hypothetical protein
MSKFDSTVNSILENLIFEQDDTSEIQKAYDIIEKTREEIKNRFDSNPEEFEANANAQIKSYDGFVDAFVDYVTNLKDNAIKAIQTSAPLKEQSGDALQDITAKVKDYVAQGAKAAGGMIGGAFEKGLDFTTDQIVENVPSIVRGLMGSDNYEQVRNEIEKVDDSLLYKALAFIDPTGVLSWPYLEKARELYEKNLGTEDEDIYTLNLLAATAAVIPGVSAFKIFAVPFKILISPIAKLFGGMRAKVIARSVTNELKTTFGLGTKLAKATTIGGKIGNFAKTVAKPIKPVAKLAASAGKAGTIIAAGDIPETWKNWGKNIDLDKIKPPERTLGKFPRFGEISTQAF